MSYTRRQRVIGGLSRDDWEKDAVGPSSDVFDTESLVIGTKDETWEDVDNGEGGLVLLDKSVGQVERVDLAASVSRKHVGEGTFQITLSGFGRDFFCWIGREQEV